MAEENEMKQYFKLNYTEPPQPEQVSVGVEGDCGRMRVTSGKPPSEPQRPQPMATITIIDHGGSSGSGGGFLSNRFGNK